MERPELEFRNALLDTAKECRKIGYNPTGFMGMMSASSAFEAVSALLAKRDVSDGFVELWGKGRLDLTVEAIILKPEWRDHFTPAEVATARRRLAEVKYRAPWDDGETGPAVPEGAPQIQALLDELAASSGDVAAGKRIRARLRSLGHFGGMRQRESDAERGRLRSTLGTAKQSVASPSILPPVPDAEALIARIHSVAGLPERNHEDVVKDLLTRLGFDAASVVFQKGRIDLCILTSDRKTAAVFEVKRTIGVESERAAGRRQGMDYASQTGALIVVVTDGDRYEIYDRRKGHDYDTMLCGKFRLTAFTNPDVEALDLLRPESLFNARP